MAHTARRRTRRRTAAPPDAQTRTVESVEAHERPDGLELVVRDRYERFAGQTRWLLDRAGVCRLTYDYVYNGEEMSAREVGARLLLAPGCQALRWRRWSERGVYPDDSISRTVGVAKARRDARCGSGAEGTPPCWSWSLNETELGTADFRGVKLNVYEASLAGPAGGVRVFANGDAHVRACLSGDGVWLHVLSQCALGPATLRGGDHVDGQVALALCR